MNPQTPTQTTLPETQSVVISTPQAPKPDHKKLILVIGGFLVLAVGLASGLFLISRPTEYNTGATRTSYQCKLIKVFDTQERQLSTQDLANLQAGDTIRFAVEGSGTTSDYTAAQFTINGTQMPETAAKLSITSNLYQEYTIPAGETAFTVTALLKAIDGNWY